MSEEELQEQKSRFRELTGTSIDELFLAAISPEVEVVQGFGGPRISR